MNGSNFSGIIGNIIYNSTIFGGAFCLQSKWRTVICYEFKRQKQHSTNALHCNVNQIFYFFESIF